MIPVERWRTWLGRQSSAVATHDPIAAWSSSPAGAGRRVRRARRRDDGLRVAEGRVMPPDARRFQGGQPNRGSGRTG